MPALFSKYRWTERIPFDSTNKFSAATVPSGDQPVHLVKGAPEKILPGCTHCIDEQGRRVPLIPRRGWRINGSG